MTASARTETSALIAYLFALVPWAGGLAILGAIVAPTVFHIVPAPSSADAMTVVFRRFDAVAISCALICLVAEATLAWRGGKPLRVDLARGAAVVAATACAITVGAWLSPAIQGLHRNGAVRGFGADGQELEHLHHIAESVSKAELFLLLGVLALVVVRARRACAPAQVTARPNGAT